MAFFSFGSIVDEWFGLFFLYKKDSDVFVQRDRLTIRSVSIQLISIRKLADRLVFIKAR